MHKYAVLCLAAWPLVAPADVEVLHFETVRDYVARDAAGAFAKPSDAALTRLSFLAFGRSFDLTLERNARLDRVHAGTRLPSGVAAYRGTLASRPGSWARIVTTPNGPAGLIWDGQTLYGLEAPNDTAAHDAASAESVMYRLADVYVPPGVLECGAALPDTSQSAAVLVESLAAELTALEAQGAALNIDIGAVADFEFHQIFGTSSETALLTRLNNVDGIFSEQLGVQIGVAEVDVFSANTDPFTSTDAEELLDELAIYRGASPAQDAQGLTHLFTGRDLDGLTVGIAFVGAICARRSSFDPLDRSLAATLSEGTRGSVVDSLIAAHEIGHSFGAPHDAESDSPCAATPATFLMAPSVNGSDRFSACSIERMQAKIAAASCLTPIGAADIDVAFQAAPATALAGSSFVHTLLVANLGAVAASATSVTVSAASSLELTAAAATAGTCVLGADSVSCELGDIPAQSTRSVTLTMRASEVGSAALTAEAGSADDANLANNVDSQTFTIVPAVDLVLSASASSLQTQQRASMPITLTNFADFGASAVRVAITLTNGLRPEAASLADAQCAISGQTLDCPAEALAARSSIALALTVSALAPGAQQITLGATAAEPDIAPHDNTLTVAIGVTDPPAAPTDAGGGGGASSWPWLAALGLFGFWRRRTRA